MTYKKIKISSIIENQFPRYIAEEFPLVNEFVSQYYKSTEVDFASSDIIQNIDQYIKIDNLFKSTENTFLTSEVSFFDTTIFVESTDGFPDSYGLLKINSEIITYTSKTDKSFEGCVRGFSGITSLKDQLNEDQLVFSESESQDHSLLDVQGNKTKVLNLSYIFVKEFLFKIKKQITPGFEDVKLFEDLNERLFIKQSKDFYRSKGTDYSFEILFKALYGKPVKIIKPRDYLIEPSNAQYRITKNIVAELISGDPLKVINGTLYQDSDETSEESRGTITNIEKIVRNNKDYYIISLDFDYNKDIDVSGTLKNDFNITPKTVILSEVNKNSNFIDVDSTISFPQSGKLIVNLENTQLTIDYESKTLSQFLGCSNITESIPSNVEIKLDTYVYSYSNRTRDEIVKFRITGVLSDIKLLDETNSSFSSKNDTIKIKTIGTDLRGLKANNWFFNVPTSYDILKLELLDDSDFSYRVVFFDNHSFVIGDKFIITSSTGENYEGSVSFIENNKTILIRSLSQINYKSTFFYRIKKQLSKVNIRNYPELNFYSANVQNVYSDLENNIYVMSPSLPSYSDTSLLIDDQSLTISGSFNKDFDLNFGDKNHNFLTGDRVVYKKGTGSPITSPGIYLVKKINDNTIRLSRSRENLFNNQFVSLSGIVTDHKLELFEFNDRNLNTKQLQPQSIIRKLSEPVNGSLEYNTSPGTTGIFINGVELLNYKSNDFIYYGPIEEITPLSKGSGYDVINPPTIEISDSIGSGCISHCSVVGSLERIDIIDQGFDYIETPIIKIEGGDGFGAETKVNLISYEYSERFNASTEINVDQNTIKFTNQHKFKNFEEVIYDSNGNTDINGLLKNSRYFVFVQDEFTIKLHKSFEDSVSGINPINLQSVGNGIHLLKSFNKKKKVGSIDVINGGQGYKNRKTFVSGINTSLDILTIKNHGYETGKIIKYYPTEIPIGGLSTSTSYYVTKLNDNQLKLSQLGVGTIPKDFYLKTKQYINITSVGFGKHYFNYDPINVEIQGKIGVASTIQDYRAVIRPVFRGEINSVFVENGGQDYGSEEILNYNRQPEFLIPFGSGAQLKPIILDGKIVDVIIQSSGQNYNSIPDIVVTGSGNGCILAPILSNGSIEKIKIISPGIGYNNDTTIEVIHVGSGVKLESKVKRWTINLVEKKIRSNIITDDDGFIFAPPVNKFGLQYTHAYASRPLRSSVLATKFDGDKIELIKDLTFEINSGEIFTNGHSPIIGWAYDGNPIYGPYGFSSASDTGEIKLMKSGYEIKTIQKLSQENRPTTSLYPVGLFVEDYEFNDVGDLDEYNGRFCITPEYPNGVYAYFSTINLEISNTNPFRGYRSPSFPYVIGNKFKSKPITYNFDVSSNQVDFDANKTNWVRNTTPYNLLEKNSGYEYFTDFKDQKNKTSNVTSTSFGSISNIKVLDSGDGYKINDEVLFNNEDYFNDLKSKVESLKGQKIKNITTEKIEIDNIQLILGERTEKFIGIQTSLSELKNGDVVNIVNLKETSVNNQIKIREPNRLILTKDVPPVTITGIITDFNVSGNLKIEVFENDLYEINTETIKILQIDLNNSTIRVRRNVTNVSGITTYKSGFSLVEKISKFNTDIKYLNSYNLKRNREIYFSSENSVGIGSSYGVGITTTLFLNTDNFNSKVTLKKGNITTLYFDRINEKARYNFNDYVNIVNSTNSGYNVDKALVVGIGNTFIEVNYNTSGLTSGIVTAFVNKWSISEIPTRTIQIYNHGFNLNDNILYNPPSSGNPIKILNPENLNNQIPLFNDRILYTLPINENLVAISTQPFSGNETLTNEKLLFFVDQGSNDLSLGQIHSFKLSHDNNLIVNVTKNIVTVETETDHNLKLDDYVTINCLSDDIKVVNVKYDDYSRSLLIDEFSFVSDNIDLETNTINIQNHNFKTGDKVWHESSSPVGGLFDKKKYYVYVLDDNKIKLVENYFELQKDLPNFVKIISKPIGSFGKLSKINPLIEVTKFSKLKFDLSDKSLSFSKGVESYPAFDFNVYTDNGFMNEFVSSGKNNVFEVLRGDGEIGISSDAYLQINFNKDVPSILYYNLTPIKTIDNSIAKLEYSIDKDQTTFNQINLIDSKYNGTFKVFDTDLNPNRFKYLITKNTEKNQYINDIDSKLDYTTSSKNALGPVNSIKITSTSKNYEYLPSVRKINSENGINCILEPESKTIGKVNSFKIQDIGFNYFSDNTIRPKIKLPDIIKVEPLSIIDKIYVTSVGQYYSESPDIIVIDKNTSQVLTEVLLNYDIRTNKVDIIKNVEGIKNNNLDIIPVNNTNGFEIDSISFNSETNLVTLTLSKEFSLNDTINFPFTIGSRIFIENVSVGVNTEGLGYNSKNYNYALFTISELNANLGLGRPTISYSLNEYLKTGEIPGSYSSTLIKGIVIPESYFPKFSVTIKKKNFSLQETVVSESGSEGIVENWDKNNELLKLSTSDDFNIGDVIFGKTSKTKAIIKRISSFEGFYEINSSSLVRGGWKRETGFLNNQFQRIQDSDYYQYFSYSLKSSIDFVKWKDPVEKLNHTVGFKKFSDLQVESNPLVSTGINTEQNLGSFTGISDFYREINLNCVNDFDLVRENSIKIDNSLVSNEIYFENKLIQDYIESFGNKTLVIDDLSTQFNSNPRPTPFSVVDTFDVNEFKYKKYFIHVIDKLFTNTSEFSIVSLLQDKNTGYLNHYGKVYSNNLIGSFDFRISELDGELLFYPKKFEINNYNINFFSLDISNIISTKSNISLGNIVKFDLQEVIIPSNSINNTFKIVGVSSSVRSLKLLVNITSSDEKYCEINELTIIHDGVNAYINEYGMMNNNNGSSFILGDVGEYNSSILGSELIVEFTPTKNFNSSLKIDSLILSINDSNSVGVGSTSINETIVGSSLASITSSETPTKNVIKSFSKNHDSSYMIISIEDTTNNEYQVSELMVLFNPSTNEVYYSEFGILNTNHNFGEIDVSVNENNIEVYFTPNPNINCEVRSFDVLLGPPTTQESVQIDKSSISIGYNAYVGTKVDIKKAFYLTNRNNPIFESSFDPQVDVNIPENKIIIPNNYFTSGEEVTYFYDPKTDFPIEIAPTSISGIGITDKLPKNVYIIKLDNNNIRVAASASDALSSTPNPITIIGVGTTGTSHKFISKKQNTKCLITIDNLIQSPLVGTSVTTSLIENLGVVDAFITVNSVDNIFSGDLIKIDNEIMKVVSVGIGSTNILLVERELAGTKSEPHSIDTRITKVKGNYNIVDNVINFLEAPYGKVPILNISGRSDELDYNGLEIGSKFSGRVFLRSGVPNSSEEVYSKNYVLDDISDEFNGIDKQFTLKYDTNTNLGSLNNDLIVLVNDIFQLQSRRDGSVTIEGDYDLIENETSGISTISFTGNSIFNNYDVNSSSIPRGGLIVSIGSTQGFGYQPLVSAGGTPVVSSAGTIQSISIGNSGSGYRSGIQTIVKVGVKTEDIIDTNIEIIGSALIENGNIVDVNITNPGLGYTTSNPPIVVFDAPLSYSNIPLIYSDKSKLGIGTGAKVDIIVGQGSSVVSFELKNAGFGYEVGDVLTVAIGGTVGIPTIFGSDYTEFQITVDEIRNDEFSAWSFGDLEVIDPIEDLFDGSRRSFPIKINGQPRSIKSKPGSDVDVQSSLLVFINDVLQVPGESYIFNGGSIITFIEPPNGPTNDLQQNGDTCKILFYRGTFGVDTLDVNILETIKVGDELIIESDDIILKQSSRIVESIKSTDIVGTNLYTKDGVSQDEFLKRPIKWCKQTQDMVINGEQITKDRILYEPLIYPVTNIIKKIENNSDEIFVKNIKTFFDNKKEDNNLNNKILILSQDNIVSASATSIVSDNGTIDSIVVNDGGYGYINSPTVKISNPIEKNEASSNAYAIANISSGIVSDIDIVNPGFGYTYTNPPLVLIESPVIKKEIIDSVQYEGDFGMIVGVKTEISGGNNILVFDFYIPVNSFLRDLSVNNVGIATTGISGIKTGYYFSVNNSNIGYGITTLDNFGNIISENNNYLDGIYEVSSVSIANTQAPGVGVTSVVRVKTNVLSFNGLSQIGFGSFYGDYSWGRIYNLTRTNPEEFNLSQSGIYDEEKSPIIIRHDPLKYRDYI